MGWGLLQQKFAPRNLAAVRAFLPSWRHQAREIMTSTNEAGEEMRDGRVDLDGLYGEIGILALVAALRYASDCKNPAYAPREPDLSTFDVSEAA
jgi:hypothetical protein